jgi:hypothetical protein
MGCNLWLLPQWGDAKQPIMFLLFGSSIWRSEECWNLKRKLEKSEELTHYKLYRSWVIGVNFCQFGPSSRYGTSIYFTTFLNQCLFFSFFLIFSKFWRNLTPKKIPELVKFILGNPKISQFLCSKTLKFRQEKRKEWSRYVAQGKMTTTLGNYIQTILGGWRSSSDPIPQERFWFTRFPMAVPLAQGTSICIRMSLCMNYVLWHGMASRGQPFTLCFRQQVFA